MKKLFLIPLMALCTCVMAFATVHTAGTFAELQSALTAAVDGDEIQLTADINYSTGSSVAFSVSKNVTIDGQGHTISGSGKCVFSVQGTSAKHVTAAVFKNLKLNNSTGRVFQLYDYLDRVDIDNCELGSQGGSSIGSPNPEVITPWSDTGQIELNLTNSKISATNSGYPIIIHNPLMLNATNSFFAGYCGLYFKNGSRGSVVNADACNFDCPNVHSGVSNAFSCFPLEDDGITLNLHNCGMNIEEIGDQNQALVTIGNISTARHENPINITLSGDNSHFNTKGGLNKCIQNLWIQNTASNKVDLPLINVTIEGGTYSVNPLPTEEEYIAGQAGMLYYGQWKKDGDGNYTGSVTVWGPDIPDTHEVQKINQGGVTLYRVVKKAAAYVDPVTSEVTLYDLNDLVPVEGEDYGNNPVSSFDLSSGEDMTLNNEVTKAGYVQISDNVTTDPESGDPVVEPTTVIINKTASDEEQTLVINNGLDVQGDSKVEVKPGASLIIGEGGINTEKPENIVLEVTEDAGAAILLDPTITVNQNPNLTVKLTTNSKQLTASPWTYVYQRFAIPVKVGVVPANDFDGELFPGNTSFKNYVFEWNGYDWVTCSSWGALKPFKGYQLANNSKDGGVTYTFTGQLVGNDNSEYNFPTGGFDFFGNSHLAPIYIDSLLKPYEDQAVEASVWLYNYDTKNFEAITSEDIAEGFAFATEIKPMEGFILNYHGTTGSAGMNYASAIWGNPKFDAAIGRPAQSNPAPARIRVSETSNRAIINVVAENGQGDNVKLVEKEKYSAEFENGADASKFVYDNAVSIYASTENGELSRVATNDLMGTLLSFNSNDATNYTITLSNVFGEDYALRDNVTGQTIAFAEGSTYTFTQAANTAVPARFEVVSAAKLPTAIDNVEEAAKVSGIYTITGQYLGRDFTNLPAGVYIVNGVKIVK